MKKKLLLILTLIAVVAMAVVGLAACDDKEGGTKLNLDGTYIEEGNEAYSIVISGNKISYVFDSSNDNLDRRQDGTFTILDKTLTVTGIKDFNKLKLDNDNLVWTYEADNVDSYDISFIKQK